MKYLGTIVTVADSSVNNSDTATPFSIPFDFPRVMIMTPDAAGVTFRVRLGGGSSIVATANDYDVSPFTAAQFACPRGNPNDTTLAVYSSENDHACKVYGLYGQAQS